MSIEDLTNQLADRVNAGNDMDYLVLNESGSIIIRGLILGVLARFILIVVPIVTALELMYICMPIMRSKADFILRKIEEKGADKRLLGLAFKDARHAIDGAYNKGKIEDSTADILKRYAVIKIKSVFFIFFILSLVLQGGAQVTHYVWVMISNLLSKLFY